MAAFMSSAAKLICLLALLAIGSLAAVLAMPVRSAPEAEFTTLAGERFATSGLRGKVAVVSFWATSCGVCVAEMPAMIETYREFAPRGLEMVTVAMRHDRASRVAEFAEHRALPFKVALDASGEVARRFGNIHITPTTFVLDRNGRVLRRFVGAPDWREFKSLVEKALAEPA